MPERRRCSKIIIILDSEIYVTNKNEVNRASANNRFPNSLFAWPEIHCQYRETYVTFSRVSLFRPENTLLKNPLFLIVIVIVIE